MGRGVVGSDHVKHLSRWDHARQVAAFGLGAFVIVDAAIHGNESVWDAVVGLILVGLVPVDAAIARFVHPPDK